MSVLDVGVARRLPATWRDGNGPLADNLPEGCPLHTLSSFISHLSSVILLLLTATVLKYNPNPVCSAGAPRQN